MPSHPTSMTMASRGTSSVARAASHSSRAPHSGYMPISMRFLASFRSVHAMPGTLQVTSTKRSYHLARSAALYSASAGVGDGVVAPAAVDLVTVVDTVKPPTSSAPSKTRMETAA